MSNLRRPIESVVGSTILALGRYLGGAALHDAGDFLAAADAAHSHRLSEVALDQMDGLRRHRVHRNLDRHGVAGSATVYPIGEQVAAGECLDNAAENTGLGVSDDAESD
jgi:hypothetical protein